MTSKIEKMMRNIPTRTTFTFASCDMSEERDEIGSGIPERLVAVFSFSKKGFGFGEIAIAADQNGQVYIDTECMGKEAVIEMFKTLVDDAITDYDRDPERHRKYDDFMTRRCANCGIEE